MPGKQVRISLKKTIFLSMVSESKQNLSALRSEMAKNGLDGFIAPRTDEFRGEYVPASAARLEWLTGFTGSAGAAAITKDKAVVMSDGRYTTQLKDQVDGKLFELGDITATSPQGWLADHLFEGAKVGFDPKLHTVVEAQAIRKALRAKKVEAVAVETNPVDAVWMGRPAAPSSTVEIFSDAIAGRSAAEKRDLIVKSIKDAGGHAAVIPLPESVAWFLNIRGTDIPHNPFALSRAIVRHDGAVDWFIDAARLDDKVRKHIGNHVRVRAPEEITSALADLATEAKKAGSPVLLDYKRAPVWFLEKLKSAGAATEDTEDPCLMPRACKTPAEQKSIVAAHIRDGVAIVRFLKWLDDEAPKGGLTEITVEEKLLSFRKADKSLRDTSFDTIVGWAANGAIVHYRATEKTNKKISGNGLLLVDSGAQYSDGTTDITRTVAVGKVTGEQRENFTLVLRGHIAVATARFPEGTVGAQVAALERKQIWDRNSDFDHGTGHGVGCYLSVHEEAASISKRGATPFKPGMLISNEPGFYKEGAYGIRIENLVLVREDGVRDNTDGKVKMLVFDTVTLAPIDRRLISVDMLTVAEKNWLNAYHERVFKTLSPYLEPDVVAWLQQAIQPLA